MHLHSGFSYGLGQNARVDVEDFDAHQSELARIRDRPDVLATRISAADAVGLVGGDTSVEIYAPAGRRETSFTSISSSWVGDPSASAGCRTRSGRRGRA
jgi:hypothetical protein